MKHYNYIIEKCETNLNEKRRMKKAILVSMDELENQIKKIVNSKSWKLTKPLRKLSEILKIKNNVEVLWESIFIIVGLEINLYLN